jgi:hypothetical protein
MSEIDFGEDDFELELDPGWDEVDRDEEDDELEGYGAELEGIG